MRIINLSEIYNRLPSEILGCDDEYTAFCFDETCGYIVRKLKEKKVPHWIEPKLVKSKKSGNAGLIEAMKKHNAKIIEG